MPGVVSDRYQFVDDTDLQSLSHVSRDFRRLSSDIVLWRYFHLVRSAAMINSRLFSDFRPDRVALVERNIMKGVQAHQIARGQYVNGPGQRSLFETKRKVDR